MPDTIRFVLDDVIRTVSDIDPTMTILQYLRDELRRTGTKEGCAEGDCGACTVVLATLHGGRIRFRAVNACIQFVPILDGKALFTVESLQGVDGSLHPVQQAMVECHASQCGFCTPGFVMSLFALYKSAPQPSRQEINDALAGNLCRCTGYRPIIEAAQRMYHTENIRADTAQQWLRRPFSAMSDGQVLAGERAMVECLGALQRHQTLELQGPQSYFAPTTLETLADLVQRYPDACLLAGGTDVGLWVTKQQRELGTVIYVGNVEALTRLQSHDSFIEIGAAVTLSDAYEHLAAHYPDMAVLLRRFASPPIRNVATLGGNIANGSPIGDSMPALIALGATLWLRQGVQTRDLLLESFYLEYRQTALRPGEFIERIHIPLLPAGCHFHTYKVSKRFDQDISAVCGAFCLDLDDGQVRSIRICYGGMAATPQRARRCEQVLMGQPWTETALAAAAEALDEDYAPMTDMRASSDYRRLVAKHLLRRLYLETSGHVACRVW